MKALLAEMQKLSFEEQKQLTNAVVEEDKAISQLESRAAKWHDLLNEPIHESVQYLQKKQSQTVEEIEAERDDDSDDGEDFDDDGEEMGSKAGDDDEDRPIYNPLNLPLGWDGKPIPFWLYKLHGMGIEYKC